jgi:hypothetical protein
MIQVTEGALDLLQSVNSDLPERADGQVLRLEALADRKLGLMMGEAQDDDQVVADDDRELLHIPSPLSAALDGGTIDRVDTPDGPRFGFTMDVTPGRNGTGG